MEKASVTSLQNDSQWLSEIERCRAEITAIEDLLLGGHHDVEGLCRALADWSAELRILSEDQTRRSMIKLDSCHLTHAGKHVLRTVKDREHQMSAIHTVHCGICLDGSEWIQLPGESSRRSADPL